MAKRDPHSAPPAPPAWKATVKARLDELDMPQWRLGELIGASQSGISQALSPQQATSQFVIPICEALDIPVPLEARLWVLGRRLSVENPEFLEAELRIMEAALRQGNKSH